MESMPSQTAKLQELLASIYLSSDERNNYFGNPQESAQAYGLCSATLDQIGKTQRESIDFYAKSLKRKRFQEIAQFIPTTMRFWNTSLKANFDSYAEKCIPSGPKKHIADLISFSHYLTNQDQLPSEAKDYLKFELIPWDMNFTLNEKEYIYKSSGTRVRIVGAHRCNGWNFKMIFYRTGLSRLMRRSKMSSLGIYLKLPYLSKSLEWYLPFLRTGPAYSLEESN